ncbi:MAG: triose-phosphate isomerase [bacterium]
MRVPLMAGNMKMFKTSKEAAELLEALKSRLGNVKNCEIVMCPSFTSLASAKKAIMQSSILLGAQDVYWEKEGAYTGEVSIQMLAEIGCSYVIIGHSERRQYFNETNDTVNKKTSAVISGGLRPIVCVGETLEERESNKTFNIIDDQVKAGLKNIQLKTGNEMVVAYEPVWAIGTGKTATPDMAQEVHAYIRKLLKEMFGETVAKNMRILYGGSVKPDNVSNLMKEKDIDGGLVGGACLKADSFVNIVMYS